MTIHQKVQKFCQENQIEILWFGQIQKDLRSYILRAQDQIINVNGSDTEIENVLKNWCPSVIWYQSCDSMPDRWVLVQKCFATTEDAEGYAVLFLGGHNTDVWDLTDAMVESDFNLATHYKKAVNHAPPTP